MAFTHLHVHSEFSLLDGLARVPDLVQAAKDRGFDALALTDHGTMYGAVKFYEQARQLDIKPIIGCELYVASRTRHDRDPRLDRQSHHLTVLAMDEVGYSNLLQLVSRAQIEGFYYRPRVDHELLEEHNKGLVVLSGCPSAEAPRRILVDDMDGARALLGWYREVFGERFFAEIQNHQNERSEAVARGIVPLAKELGLPLVATNDVHYARAEDVSAHEVLLCVQMQKTINDSDRMRYGSTFYLRSEEEMRAAFAEIPQAVDNTTLVSEMCDLQLDFSGYKLPKFDLPGDLSAGVYLRSLCEDGLKKRYESVTADVQRRLDVELDIIGQMGFDDYFLIVWDLCRFARDQGVWWNVRGSGAGSIVAYALFITSIDPLAHGLIFERFLNPARVSMPDIDLDFPDDQRDDLIRYTFDKYGRDHVAQIITFGTLGARAAIRDVGRALAVEGPIVDQVARLVPAVPGKPCTIDDALREEDDDGPNEFYTPELAKLAGTEETVRNLLDTAKSLEGVTRHASTHAAGVVISDRPLVEYVPLHRPTRGSEDDDTDVLPVTQFDMNDVEKLGMLKVDFLGLSTLTVLRRAAELVLEHHDVKFTLDNIPLDDERTYDLLSSGHVTGVFQVEGAGMRRMLRQMRPKRFEHVVAAIALYRPGPMENIPSYIARMHGSEEITYRHEALEPILAETFGIIVYQEQIIQIARDLSGYDAGEADLIRKAVSKKIKPELLRHREMFIDGAVDNGYPKSTAAAIFDDIEHFARYGFNKAHAADYAVIVCQTAYLKAHYPVEYLAALLTVDRDNTDKIALVAADCRRMGLKLLGPNVNASGPDFTLEPLDDETRADPEVTFDRGVRFGMAAIKNVGDGPVRAIVKAREDTPFADLEDLSRRVDLRQVGRRALESLVKAGALDQYGDRAQLLAVLDRLVAYSTSHHVAAEAGQMSLFGETMPATAASLLYPLPDAVGDRKEELMWEKELLGLYLSEHPLHHLADEMADSITCTMGDIDEEMDGQNVTVAGMVVDVRRITTKKGAMMAFVRVEDLHGSVEATVFPRVYEATRELWADDAFVLINGRVDVRNDRAQLIVDTAEEYLVAARDEQSETVHSDEDTAGGGVETDAPEPYVGPSYQLYVTVPRSGDQETDVARLAEVFQTLTRYHGSDTFSLNVAKGAGTVEVEFPNHTTRYCVGLLKGLEALVGEGRVQVQSISRPERDVKARWPTDARRGGASTSS